VIKFIRYTKYELPFWMNALSFFEKGKSYRQRRLDFRQHKFFHSLQSYEIADQLMREETGLVFSHLQPTSCFAKSLLVKDRLGRKFSIDLDQCGFLLQRKVVPLRSKFLTCKKHKDLLGAKELTLSFLKTVQEMAKKKIVNCDYNCVKNSGVLENRVVFLDLGSFFSAKDKGNPSLAEQMYVFTKHFRKWAIKEYPELLPFFEEELIKFSQESSQKSSQKSFSEEAKKLEKSVELWKSEKAGEVFRVGEVGKAGEAVKSEKVDGKGEVK
jgi:hypothetical protein